MSIKRLEPTRENLTAAAQAVKEFAESQLQFIGDCDIEVFGESEEECFFSQQLLLAEYVLVGLKGKEK